MDKTPKEKNYLIKHDFTNQILETYKLSARTTNNTITVSDFKSWLLKTKDVMKEHLRNGRLMTFENLLLHKRMSMMLKNSKSTFSELWKLI